MFFNFFKSKRVLGLDIGTSSIKIAELDVSGAQAQLVHFSLASTPPNSVSGGEIVDAASIASVIESLIAENQIKTKNIATTMWGTSVIVKKITIPKMDRKTLQSQIRFEAEQYLPFDLNNIRLVYHVLEKSATQDTMDVILVAAQNELVTQYVKLIEISGLRCSILDVGGFALANIFEFNHGKHEGQTVALLNFGASITTMSILQNGEVIFTRDIPVGGNSFTNEIHKTLGVTMAEAESLKLSAVTKSEVPDEIHSIMSATNETIADEIRSSFDFFSASNSSSQIQKCFFTGGSSSTPGLSASVSRLIKVPMEPFNPLRKIKYNPSKFSAEFIERVAPFSALALGLALRKQGDHD